MLRVLHDARVWSQPGNRFVPAASRGGDRGRRVRRLRDPACAAAAATAAADPISAGAAAGL